MNHNPPPPLFNEKALIAACGGEPMDPGIVALLPAPVKEPVVATKPKVDGPYVARIRVAGKPEIVSKFLPNSDAALQWAYGFMALRASASNPSGPVYPDGTTVHIGAMIYVLHNRALRPIGLRRVLAVKQPTPPPAPYVAPFMPDGLPQ